MWASQGQCVGRGRSEDLARHLTIYTTPSDPEWPPLQPLRTWAKHQGLAHCFQGLTDKRDLGGTEALEVTRYSTLPTSWEVHHQGSSALLAKRAPAFQG